MTPTSALIAASGLSHREVAAMFNVAKATVDSWSAGRNPTPKTITDRLRQIVRDNLADAKMIAQGRSPEGYSAIVFGLALGMAQSKAERKPKAAVPLAVGSPD